MTDVDNTDHNVHSSEVQKAAQKLRAKKTDGEKGLWSNHIKFGPNELFDHKSKQHLLTSSINSIPKDKLGDMSDSNNYRGTTLISAIVKVYDLILIQWYQVNLKTSDLQFAYKCRHST